MESDQVRELKQLQDGNIRLKKRARKKIEEPFGEGKDWHGLRRFRQRGIPRIREEGRLIGWVLNLKRLAKLLGPQERTA